jgi:uracil-DNA glycosylase family 4
MAFNSCAACPLASKDQVGGRGPKDAKLIVFGGYPNRDDERTGKPFTPGKSHVESAASSVHNAIKLLGLHPEKDIYWVNSLRCNPFRRVKKPLASHVVACRQANLEQELQQVNTPYILAMGNLPVISLFEDTNPNIFEYRNKWHNVSIGQKDRLVRVTFAPEQIQNMSLWEVSAFRDGYSREKRWSPPGSCTWFFQQDLRAVREMIRNGSV